MKVEFKESEHFGLSLVITYIEYMKALKNDDELNSLRLAIDSYKNLLKLNYDFDLREYQRVTKFLKKDSIVYYHPLILEYPSRRELLITAIQDNEIKPIRKQSTRGEVFTPFYSVISDKNE
ncbi:MAG TPA: hypothetical protein PKC96_03950 [Bacilli bacterium]|nr:hypothetical protein [Bacilli bacterium]